MKIAIDFDNVIYDHDGIWRGGELTRGLVAGADEAMQRIALAGHKIIIYSTRNWNPKQRKLMSEYMTTNAIPFDEISTKKPTADVYLDDKAMKFESWDNALGMLGVVEKINKPLKVVLYNVWRNLNRAYRTCFSFGISEMILVGKSDDRTIEWELKGNLFEAKNKVKVMRVDEMPDITHAVAFENYYTFPLSNVNWADVDTILIGGESTGLPKSIKPLYKATIPTVENFCLTVEAALAIGLYSWSANNGGI
jgi:hypothetical protein